MGTMHVVGYCVVVSGWEEREESGTMHVRIERREEDHEEAFGWSSRCQDSGIAPPCLSPLC